MPCHELRGPKGVPPETRRALDNGNTEFLRELHGGARLYPDTDSQSILNTEYEINEIEKNVIRILRGFIDKNAICGKDPKGLCAGAIYLVSKIKNKRVSQKEISTVVGVTEVTLRSRYKELMKNISINYQL